MFIRNTQPRVIMLPSSEVAKRKEPLFLRPGLNELPEDEDVKQQIKARIACGELVVVKDDPFKGPRARVLSAIAETKDEKLLERLLAEADELELRRVITRQLNDSTYRRPLNAA